MKHLYLNNFRQALAAAITDSATEITLDANADLLTGIVPGESLYPMTLFEVNEETGAITKSEVVYVTGNTTGTLTISRAQEGTTAQPWAAGAKIGNRVTAGGMNEAFSQLETHGNTLLDHETRVGDNETAVQGHETRITTLENEPEPSAGGLMELLPVGTLSVATGFSYAGTIPALPADTTFVPTAVLFHCTQALERGVEFSDTKVYGAATGEPIYHIAYSPDSADMILASDNGLFKVLTSAAPGASGLPVYTENTTYFDVGVTFDGDGIYSAFKPDGTQLACATDSTTDGLYIIDTTTGTRVAGTGTYTRLARVAWSDDGTKLLVVSNSNLETNVLTVLQVSDWTVLNTFTKADLAPNGLYNIKLAEFMDNNTIVVAGNEGDVNEFNSEALLIRVNLTDNTWDYPVRLPVMGECMFAEVDYGKRVLAMTGYANVAVLAVDLARWRVMWTVDSNVLGIGNTEDWQQAFRCSVLSMWVPWTFDNNNKKVVALYSNEGHNPKIVYFRADTGQMVGFRNLRPVESMDGQALAYMKDAPNENSVAVAVSGTGRGLYMYSDYQGYMYQTGLGYGDEFFKQAYFMLDEVGATYRIPVNDVSYAPIANDAFYVNSSYSPFNSTTGAVDIFLEGYFLSRV